MAPLVPHINRRLGTEVLKVLDGVPGRTTCPSTYAQHFFLDYKDEESNYHVTEICTLEIASIMRIILVALDVYKLHVVGRNRSQFQV
jgi:hypothetical protein